MNKYTKVELYELLNNIIVSGFLACLPFTPLNYLKISKLN